MNRVLTFLAVALLAAAGWWIAREAGSGGEAPTAEEGLVVHVRLTDRQGAPVHPAQIVRVYDESREHVDTQGTARLSKVTLRADEAPSAEAFAVALKPLTHYHAPRRGDLPEVARREDGSWDVHYRLHPHGILRMHVEPVNLGACKAFPERDEPLQRWEPVGAHAVVRPGSVVDFRIFEGWDAPPANGKVAVRLVGEPGPDGVPTVATQRLLVDAPSPGHTAQLTLIPDPVDPIAGSVRIKEGPNPPTLRGMAIVRRVTEGGDPVYLGVVPIDDEGSFVVRDAGPGRYEIVAGLDFAPGLITAEAEGGGYLELETPGRGRWVEITGLEGAPAHAAILPPEDGVEGVPPTIHELLVRRWWTLHRNRWMEDPTATSGLPWGWARPAVFRDGDTTAVALPGAGTWTVALSRAGDRDLPGAQVVLDPVTLAEAASRAQAAATWNELPHGVLVVDVDPEGWGAARSVELELPGTRHKRTLVRGGTARASFEHVAAGDHRLLRATWDDPDIAPMSLTVAVPADGTTTPPVRVRARPGGAIHARLTGPGAEQLTAEVQVELRSPDGTGRTEHVTLVRRGAAPVWTSRHAAPAGTWTWSLDLVATHDGAPWVSVLAVLPDGASRGMPRELVIRPGETTTLAYELPAK